MVAFARRAIVEAGHLGLTIAYASGLTLLFLSPAKRFVLTLAPVGRMALTWYLSQTLFGIWLFYGFAHGPALMGRVGPATLFAIAVGGFIVQVWLSHVWLTRFPFGPAEWLWRALTYWRVQFGVRARQRAVARGWNQPPCG